MKPAPDGSPDAKANRIQNEIVGRLGEQLAGDPTAKAYTQSMVTNLEPDPTTAFDFALAHEEKNKETLQATAGRLNRDQIDEAVQKWDAKHPRGPPLYQQLGMFEQGKGVLEGDARNETEIKFMGVPRNDRERAETANMAAKQQVRDSGAAGRAVASEEYRRMLATQAKLLGFMGVTAADIDEKGRIRKKGKDGQDIVAHFDKDGKLLVKTDKQRDEFEAAMQLSYLDAGGYKDAVDRAAMGITMALMVIAAAITTFVTFGGAAAIWAPILITAGAGLVGIAMTAAIKGDRYTSAEIQRDLVMTFVQAATAGLGAYAGTALRSTGAAAKAAATTEKVAGGIAGVAEKQAVSLGAKAMNLGKEVVIDSAVGGTTNMINSATGAAMDPENRRQGKSGQKALEGGAKGFLSSAVGSSLTKPIGALAKPVGKMAERISGNVAAGFGTRLTEARVGQAMGEPHQSWAESLESAKEGIAQDVLQGAAEHGAEHFADRRATVRAQRAARAREEPPAPAVTRTPVEEPLAPAKPGALAEAPQHTTASLARAAAVHEALPPQLRPAVDGALLPKPVAPRPIEPVVPRAVSADDEPTLRIVRPAEEPVTPPLQPPRPAAEPDRPTLPRPDPVEEAKPPTRRRPGPEGAEEAEPPTRRRPPPLPEDAGRQAARRRAVAALPVLDELPEGSPMMPPNPRSRAQAEEMLRNSVRDEPHREVGVYVNTETGEHVLIQGSRDRVFVDRDAQGNPVGILGEGNPQRWKEILDSHRGNWLLVAHNHPGQADASRAGYARRLPSGSGGDFSVLQQESAMLGGRERHSSILVTHEGRTSITEFAYDPTLPRPYAIIYDDPATGQRVYRRFASLESYGEFFHNLTGVSPHLNTPGAPATAHRPPPIEMLHGTHSTGAASIREQGIQLSGIAHEHQDFGRAFYLALDEPNAALYATDAARTQRAVARGDVPEVVRFTFRLEDLGDIVDVRPGGPHRAQWEEFLALPAGHPSLAGVVPKAPALPGRPPPWTTARDYVMSYGVTQRGVVFTQFLEHIGMAHAPVVRGDLGGLGTSGRVAGGGGEQIAIRSQEAADRLSAAMRGVTSGEPPVPAAVPASVAPREGVEAPAATVRVTEEPAGAPRRPEPELPPAARAVPEPEAVPAGGRPVAPPSADAPMNETAAEARARAKAERRQELDEDLRGHQAEAKRYEKEQSQARRAAAEMREGLPRLPAELREWLGDLPPGLSSQERVEAYSARLGEPGLSEPARRYLEAHREYHEHLEAAEAAGFGAQQAKEKVRDVEKDIDGLSRGRTAEEERAEVAKKFGQRTDNAELESAISGLSEYGRAYVRQYEKAMAALAGLGVKPEHIVNALAGRADTDFATAFRQQLRSGSLDVLRAASPARAGAVLQRLLDAQPNNSSRGALFHAFREANMPSGFRRVDPGVAGTTIARTPRMADGVLEITEPPGSGALPGPKERGRYLAEDKAGAGAFDRDQARHYSSQIGEEGKIRTADGKSHNGVVYFFDTIESARAATRYMDGNGLNPRLHVSYFDAATGQVRWLR